MHHKCCVASQWTNWLLFLFIRNESLPTTFQELFYQLPRIATLDAFPKIVQLNANVIGLIKKRSPFSKWHAYEGDHKLWIIKGTLQRRVSGIVLFKISILYRVSHWDTVSSLCPKKFSWQYILIIYCFYCFWNPFHILHLYPKLSNKNWTHNKNMTTGDLIYAYGRFQSKVPRLMTMSHSHNVYLSQ